MNKIILIVYVLVFAVCLVGCSVNGTDSDVSTDTQDYEYLRNDTIMQAVRMMDAGVESKKKFSEYFKENIYVNPSGMLYGEQLRYCLETFGVDHIMWGEDYPYRKKEDIRTFLEKFALSEEEREKIAYINAEKLLHINE